MKFILSDMTVSAEFKRNLIDILEPHMSVRSKADYHGVTVIGGCFLCRPISPIIRCIENKKRTKRQMDLFYLCLAVRFIVTDILQWDAVQNSVHIFLQVKAIWKCGVFLEVLTFLTHRVVNGCHLPW